jgi:hypothetical protein
LWEKNYYESLERNSSNESKGQGEGEATPGIQQSSVEIEIIDFKAQEVKKLKDGDVTKRIPKPMVG